MKNEDESIDKLFRQGLTDPVNETGFREDDWDDLELLLDKSKKRRGIVFWLSVMSGVAAMILLALGWWLFKPVAADNSAQPQQVVMVEQPKQQSKGNTNPTDETKESSVNMPSKKTNTIKPGVNLTPYIANMSIAKPEKTATSVPDLSLAAGALTKPISTNMGNLVAANTGINIDAKASMQQYINSAVVSPVKVTNDDYAKSLAVKRNAIVTQSSFKRPQFALTIIGASELNGVNSFQQGKSGTNFGLLFSVGMNKLTVSTGMAYSSKPYNTSFSNYHSSSTYVFKTDPIDVVADCRVIDLPLNVDYQLYNKHQNKFSIGTGVSSYLMMHESYTYDYADPTTKGPRNYAITSPGNYFFGILNLQATYQRQINSKVGISIQPYLKLPLTSIGASEVKLQSTGVAIGLSWNINSLTKP